MLFLAFGVESSEGDELHPKAGFDRSQIINPIRCQAKRCEE
jgi:hypothetical protein